MTYDFRYRQFPEHKSKKQFLYWKNKYTRDRTCSLKLETYEDKIVQKSGHTSR